MNSKKKQTVMETEVETLTLETLSMGTIQVWDDAFGKKLSSALNPLLRAYYNPHVAEPINFPNNLSINFPTNYPAATITETTIADGTGLPIVIEHDNRHVDHFLEIQHVIAMILGQQGATLPGICARPLAEWLRVSRFLNHKYNLYSIPAAYNLYKSKVSFEFYKFTTGGIVPPEQQEGYRFMKVYLDLEVDGDDLARVQDRILELCRAMKQAQGANNYLCVIAGTSMETFLNEVEPSLAEKLKDGMFDQSWMEDRSG